MGCPDCMLLFSSEEEMMGHFTLPPHQPPPFSQPNKCPVMTCDMNFPNRSKLILHMREGRHGQPCPQCGKSFPKVCYFNRQLISRKNVNFVLIIHMIMCVFTIFFSVGQFRITYQKSFNRPSIHLRTLRQIIQRCSIVIFSHSNSSFHR